MKRAFLWFAACVTWACGTDVTRQPGAEGAGGPVSQGGGDVGGTGPAPPGAQPPAPPTDPSPPDAGSTTLAIDRLFMGDTDLDGSPSPAAWKQFGYNLDGVVVDCSGAACSQLGTLCQPLAGGSPSSVYPDGNNGIDNAFGKLLLPIFTGLVQDFSVQLNDAILTGERTTLFDLVGVGSAANYAGNAARLYEGADLFAPPAFDGSDAWPLTSESLLDPNDTSSAKSNDPNSYVSNHTWVGHPANMELRMISGGMTMVVPIVSGVVSMNLAADRQSADFGVIAGVIPVEPFVEVMRDLAGSFDPGLCSGTTFESLADQIRQAADILIDGGQDPSLPCSAISIGIGFNASAVTLGAVAAAVPPPPDPCGP